MPSAIRNYFGVLLICVATTFLQAQSKPLPRIVIAGLGIESSTFSPALTNEEAFHAKYGAAVLGSYPFLSADSPLLNHRVEVIEGVLGAESTLLLQRFFNARRGSADTR